MKLSICMIIKDEETNLERCLSSLIPLMNKIESELIIVDTGSTDKSPEIAKKYTDKVYFHEWNNNFSDMRNISIGYAKGEWVFIFDADEELEIYNHIVEFINSDESKKYNTASILCKNIMGESKHNSIAYVALRFFRNNGKFRYKGVIHNTPVIALPIMNLNDVMLHYGYMTTNKEMIEKKFKRTATLLLKELEKNPYDIYLRYQLSVSYFSIRDFDNALKECEKAYSYIYEKALNAREYAYIYVHFVKCLFILKKLERAELICKEGIQLVEEQFDLHCSLGEIYIELRNFDEAENSFKKYLELVRNFDNLSIRNDNMMYFEKLEYYETVYKYLTDIYYSKNDFYSVLEYSNLVKSKDRIKEFIPVSIVSYLELEKYEELNEYYLKVSANSIEDKEYFCDYLETKIENIESENLIKLYKALSHNNDKYSILNQIRSSLLDKREIEVDKINNYLTAFDFNNLQEYYGDVLYYCLKNDVDFYSYLINVTEVNIIKYFLYLEKKYENFIFVIETYIKKYENKNNFIYVRVNKVIFKTLIAASNYDDETYRERFLKYIDLGSKYINYIYNKELIVNEWLADIKSNEEAFLIYINKALETKQIDKSSCIKFLKRGLGIYPEMKKGMKILLENIEEEFNKENQEFELYKIQIKNSIKDLTENNELDEADRLIIDYETIVKNDIEIYSMKAVIAIIQDRLSDAQEIVKSGLEIQGNNFDLNYNLAYIYEKKGLYLNALETYEKIVFNMEECEQQKKIIEYLNVLEDKNRETIQKQLNEIKSNEEVFDINTKKSFKLHLMYDSQYCDKFIHFVNKHFNKEENLFIIIGNINQELRFMNVKGLENVKVIDLKFDLQQLLNYIQESSVVFVHYLFDYFCKLICEFNVKKDIYWILWGGDLYNYIDYEMYGSMTIKLFKSDNKVNKNTIEYVYRKAAIRKIKYVLPDVRGDFDILKENFIFNAPELEFMYPNPVDFIQFENKHTYEALDKYNFKGKFKYVVLAGNSANPSNNHLEIIEKLKNVKSKDFCVVMPLSYGGQENYVDFIINEGKKVFGDRFIALIEYLNPKDYFGILKQVDVAIFNQSRQQALSNISILAYLGRKIILNDKNTIYNWFKAIEVSNIENINQFNNDLFLDNLKVNNKKIVKDYFSDERCLSNFKSILKTT